MSNRLPIPGSDDGSWGDILNAYLEVSLASDGTLNPKVVGTNQIQNNAVTNAQLDTATQTTLASIVGKYTKPAGGIPDSDLSASVQTSLNNANSAVQSVNNQSPTSGNVLLTASNIGAVPTTATVNGHALSANITLSASDVSAIPLSQLGAAGGVATLDGSSHLAASQLPASMVTDSQGTNAPLIDGASNALINIPTFQASTSYPAGYVVQQDGVLYARNTTGSSGVSWAADSSNWKAISLPGGVSISNSPTPGETLISTGTASAAWSTGSVNNQTGTTYTFAATDSQALVTGSNSSALTHTIPANTSVAFGVPTQIVDIQLGTGTLSVVPASGVTLYYNGSSVGSVSAASAYGSILITQVATNTWVATVSGASSGGGSSLPAASLYPQWLPSGALSENFPRLYGIGSDTGLTSGTPYIVAGPYLQQGVSYGHISFYQSGTAPATQTHAWVALLDTSGNVLAVTADAGSSAWKSGTFTWVTLAFSSAYVPASSRATFVAVMVAASTVPTFRGMDGSGALESLSPVLFGNSTLTGQTTPPSVGGTMALPTSSGNSLTYFYLTA